MNFDDFEEHGLREDLVVILHGWGLSADNNLREIREAVRQAKPDSDILVPTFYLTGTPTLLINALSNLDPADVAKELAEGIERQFEVRKRVASGRYQRVTLIAYSVGALIMREAWLQSMGDIDSGGLRGRASEWALSVERIILMAGMSRGWTLWPKPEKMPVRIWLSIALLLSICTLTGTGRLIRSVRRGKPFIANLRVRWVGAWRSGVNMPLTIQLLGGEDEIVRAEDTVDLECAQNFIFLHTDAATHSDILRLTPERRAIFAAALLLAREQLEQHAKRKTPVTDDINRNINRVVFILHGIRDFGEWTTKVAKQVSLLAPEPDRVVTCTASYGYFSLVKFLVGYYRQKNVLWFMDQYTEHMSRYPMATFSFAGHSNGTYILASALENYPVCTVDYAVFAGSVINRNYAWSYRINKTKQLTAIRNYVATADWVVGLFPNFMGSIGMPELGAAGLRGFEDAEARRFQVEYVKGGHGAAIEEEHHPFIASFLLFGPKQQLGATIERTVTPSGWLDSLVDLAAKYNAFAILLAVMILVAIGAGLVIWTGRLYPGREVYAATTYLLGILYLASRF